MEPLAKSNDGCSRFAIGCGLVMLFLALVLGVGGFYAFNKMGDMFSQGRKIAELFELEKRIVNRSAYIPPSDGQFTLEQVESLVYIQTRMRDAIGANYPGKLEAFQDLLVSIDEDHDWRKLPEVFNLSRSLLAPLLEAKAAQVDAINQRGLSASEYSWMRDQAIKSLGISGDELRRASGSEAREPLPAPPPSQNTRLLNSHLELLFETLPFSALGL
jgi:hypothetical protein